MTNSLRSVHITNYYHKNSGGISTSYNNLLAAAERHERRVCLIVPGPEQAVEDVNAFARIYYIAAKRSPVFDKRYRIIMPWQYMINPSIVRDVLLEEMPDMIEVTDKYSLSFMGAMIRMNYFKQIGRPMLVHFSCERMDDNVASFLIKGRAGKALAHALMRNYNLPIFDFHIANSVYTADEFYASVETAEKKGRAGFVTQRLWRLFRSPRVPLKERVYIAPRGVDSHRYSPARRSAAARRVMADHAKVPGNATILLYSGRISPEKNIELLVDMMKVLGTGKNGGHRLLVAGDGPKTEWLRSQSKRNLDGKIVLLGHLESDTLADYYANADIFVHPNAREPFGIAPLEAMASGVPVLAPNAGGILTYATDDNAWLTEPNGEAFAAVVDEICGDTAQRETKVALALATARENTRESSTDHLFATYDKMYLDFSERIELFTDRDATRKFDYSEVI